MADTRMDTRIITVDILGPEFWLRSTPATRSKWLRTVRLKLTERDEPACGEVRTHRMLDSHILVLRQKLCSIFMQL
jgi:hypothetical protein